MIVGPLAALVSDFDFLDDCFDWCLFPTSIFGLRSTNYSSWLERPTAHPNIYLQSPSSSQKQAVTEISLMQLAAEHTGEGGSTEIMSKDMLYTRKSEGGCFTLSDLLKVHITIVTALKIVLIDFLIQHNFFFI